MSGLHEHWTVVEVDALAVDENTVLKEAWKKAEVKVIEVVEKVISQCEKKKTKFTDESFGPRKGDEDGAFAFYASGKAPNANYANPSECIWVRPKYEKKVQLLEEEMKEEEEEEEEEEESDDEDEETVHSEEYEAEKGKSFCEHGALFLGGVNANDVIQGRLGDCWLLSAMGVLATRVDLIEKVFWKSKSKKMEAKMRKYGFRVCRFFKDNKWFFVIIDDTLPVFAKTGKPVFAHCKDNNELWVCFLEKAYAKLHKSYDALIGGYIDGALRDMTGLACQELVLRQGHTGYHPKNKEDLENGNLWKMLDEYLNQWGCMVGCSIQPDPSEKGSAVEQAVGTTGLKSRHAYSLIDVGQVKTKEGVVKLLRLRNPWGFGEWTGAWSDNSAEFKKYAAEIEKEFDGPICKVKRDGIISSSQKVESNEKDGTFFMAWEDWVKYFTVIFAAVDFPEQWSGQRVCGQWTKQTSGGNNTLKTWSLNPKHRIIIHEDNTRLFISLCQDDPRLTKGKEQFKFQDPIGFHIVQAEQGKPFPTNPPATIPGSMSDNHAETQAPYKLHLTVDLDIPAMKKGMYTIVPSTYFQNREGPYFLHVYSDKPISLEDGRLIAEEEEDNGKYTFIPFKAASSASTSDKIKVPDASKLVDFEKRKSALIQSLAQKQKTVTDLYNTLKREKTVSWDVWSHGLQSLGVAANKPDFSVFSGSDGVLDKGELKLLVAAEKETNRLFGSTMGDEALAPPESNSPTPHVVTAGSKHVDVLKSLVHSVKTLESENDQLRAELDAVRDEQARMMHVLLLYGKMLKCYDGPEYNAKDLRKPSSQKPASRAGAQAEELLSQLEAEMASSRPSKPVTAPTKRRNSTLVPRFVEEAGDEFMAVKPWKGAIKAPSNPPKADSISSKKLSLEWVFSYNSARNGLFETSGGSAVFYGAAAGVVYDPKEHKQLHFLGHNDDIVSMDVKKDLVVTGQVGKKPFACVWDASTGKLVQKLDQYNHQRAIACVAFSTDLSTVLTVGGDDDHYIAAYEVKTGKVLGSFKGSKETCLFAVHTGKRFVTGGVRHILFWDESDYSKKAKPGRFSKIGGGAPQTLPCAISIPDCGKEVVVTGVTSGALLVWGEDRRIADATEPDTHGGKPVDALCYDTSQKKLLSGGKDGSYVVWSFDAGSCKLSKLQQVKKQSPIACLSPSFVGLCNGDVYKDTELIFSGHGPGELWGLAQLDETRFVTVGDDAVLKVWDSTSHKLLQSKVLAAGPSRAVSYCPSSKTIAVGFQSNAVALFDADTLEQKAETGTEKAAAKASSSPSKTSKKKRFSRQDKLVLCIQFSPDGAYLALGSNDSNVYVLCAKTLKTKAVLKKSSSSVTHLDWSSDAKYIRTNDSSYELLFYDVNAKSQVTSATAMRDVEWATVSCPLTWETQGVWPPDADGTDINSVSAAQHNMLASADDSGNVNVFPYPFPERNEEEVVSSKGAAHASHVTNVKFLESNKLVSTGGNDRTAMLWNLV